jgi:hypothetical protein
VKRWFFGLMLVLSAIFAIIPMPSVGQTPQTAPYAPPRTREGQPDLQGIWQAVNTASWDLEAHNASIGVPAGHSVVDGGVIPYQPAALARKKENFAKRGELDPETKCWLPGVPRITYMPHPFQIVQQTDNVTFLYEYRNYVRNVWMNGNPHPEGPIDWWMGDSRGSWDGNTLVVDLIHFNDQTWFDRAGNFHSEALHVVERYTPMSPYHLQYEATIEDPKVFTRPWKISMPLYRRMERTAELLEYSCPAYLLEQEWNDPNSNYFRQR